MARYEHVIEPVEHGALPPGAVFRRSDAYDGSSAAKKSHVDNNAYISSLVTTTMPARLRASERKIR